MNLMNAYNFNFKNDIDRYIHKLMCDETFLAVGLELSELGILIENNEDFELKGFTFAYYNPIENAIHINIDDKFFTKEKNIDMIRAKMLFIVLHEVHHHILLHTDRCNDRERMLWNMAADYEIHNLLHNYKYLTSSLKTEFENISNLLDSWDKPNPPEGSGCYSSKYDEDTAEIIYEKLLKDNKFKETESFELDLGNDGSENEDKNDKNGKGQGGMKAKVKVYTKENKDGSTSTYVDIEYPKQEKSEEQKKKDANDKALKKKMMEHGLTKAAEEMNKIGNGSCKFNEFIKKLFKVKVDWERILKASINNLLSKSDYFTWRRPSSVGTMLDMYLPSIEEDFSKYGTLVVALDESGSMSTDDVAKAFAVIREAKEYYKQVCLLEHDTKIISEAVFEDITPEVEKSLCTRKACGGTSHKEVFEKIKNWNKEHANNGEDISCCIMITDGESDIEQYQDTIDNRIPIIYLTSSQNFPKSVKGKVIGIN